MTDRYSGYVVILEDNIRDDDAQDTINAIKQIKGVLDVTPIVSDFATMIAEKRARIGLLQKMITIINDDAQP